MRALPHGAVADALATVRASQAPGHHQLGVRQSAREATPAGFQPKRRFGSC